MSWLYSQALVEAYLRESFSAGEPCARSNVSPTQLVYLHPGKMTGFSRLSRFGMTFRHLTESPGVGLLMWYLAGFHARTSVPQGGVRASMDRAAACGSIWPASSVRFDLNASLWKTAHCLWEEVLLWSSVILPRWGMTRSGFVFQHPTAERPINVTVSGLWRTPNAHVIDQKSTVTKLAGRKPSDPQVGLADQVMAVERWMYPTPGFNDYKSGTGYRHGDKKQTPQLRHLSGGQLNPTWVEWLMGWPLGWTDLKPLAMDRFLEWQQQHSNYYVKEAA